MQSQYIQSGNTQRKKALYQKNSMYGTNLTESQMQQMEKQKKKQQQQLQQKRRLQQQRKREQQLQRNDISIEDLYPQQSQSSFQMTNPMRKQKQVQLQQDYPQKQRSFQMTNPMRKQKQIQRQQVYPPKQQSSFQMTNPMQNKQQQQIKLQQMYSQSQAQALRSQKQTMAERQQPQQQRAGRKTVNQMQTKQKEQKRQIRSLLNDLRSLNPKYYWQGIGVGRSGYAPTLPIASQILFELSNRPQLNENHIDQIDSILQQKTEDDALLKIGKSPAFGSKYRTFNDFLKSAQRRQLYQQMNYI